MKEETKIKRKKRIKARKAYERFCKTQLCDKPTEKQVRVYRKAMKKHKLKPSEYPRPTAPRNWIK